MSWPVPWGDPVPLREQVRVYRRLLRHRPPRAQIKFFVFGQGRTGSTLLIDLLRNSPGVRCDDEILDHPVRWPRLWLDGHRVVAPHLGYGFKVKIYQLTEAQHIADVGGWLEAMHRRGWAVVFLWRRNLLRHVVSNMVAERRGSFAIRGAAPAAVEALHVDADHLVHWMKVRQENGRQERAALQNVAHVSVCYEDDLLDPASHQRTLDRLCDHLRLPRATAQTDVRRTVVGPLSDTVANADEIAVALRGTEWERYLD